MQEAKLNLGKVVRIARKRKRITHVLRLCSVSSATSHTRRILSVRQTG